LPVHFVPAIRNKGDLLQIIDMQDCSISITSARVLFFLKCLLQNSVMYDLPDSSDDQFLATLAYIVIMF
jgi:hypothetical protein